MLALSQRRLCCSATEQQYLCLLVHGLGACLLEEACSLPNRLVVLEEWRKEGTKSSSKVLALGCILEIAPVPLGAGRREGERKGTREGRKSCLQTVSTLAVKTFVLHDVENHLGSGHRPLIACTDDTPSQLLLYLSQPFSVLGVS